MKTAIVYYSQHHGNTKKLIDAIAEKNEMTLIDVTKDGDVDLGEYDLTGFASGIYYSKFNDKGSNEKLTSSTCDFDLVFCDLRNFYKVSLYKSTLKSDIIRSVKVVCLHSKQTTGIF